MHFNQLKIGITFAALLMTGTSGYASVVQVCDSTICQPFTYFDEKSVLENLTEMFKENSNQILLCHADSSTKECLPQPLMFNGQTTLMNVNFQIPFMRILQRERMNKGLSLSLDYQVRANDKYPQCSASVSPLIISSKGEMTFTSPSFECQATELGKTLLTLQFKIDYINFATGRIGANYEVASFGDVLGDGSGYVMMQVSSERSIQLKRPQPSYDAYHRGGNSLTGTYSHKSGQLVDWDKENIKTKWNSFKEKFLKILYLEPIE